MTYAGDRPDVREAIDGARAEHEAPAELKRVLAGPALPMTGRPRPLARCGIVPAEQVEERCLRQSRGAIRVSLLVDEQRETDFRFLAKPSSVAHVAEADRGEIRAFLDELAFMVAQLRDVLAAEQSAVVPKEDHDGGTARPQRAEANLSAFRVGQNERRQRFSDRSMHPRQPRACVTSP